MSFIGNVSPTVIVKGFISGNYEDVSASIVQVNNDITAVNSAITVLNNDIYAIVDDAIANTTIISNITNDISSINTSISNLNSIDITHTSQISTINTTLTTKANASTVNAISTDLYNDINNLASNYLTTSSINTLLSGKTDVATTSAIQTQLTNDINNLASNYLTTSSINTLLSEKTDTSTTSAIQTQLTNNINNLANNYTSTVDLTTLLSGKSNVGHTHNATTDLTSLTNNQICLGSATGAIKMMGAFPTAGLVKSDGTNILSGGNKINLTSNADISTVPANGQLLIGSTSTGLFGLATITPTANQINITNASNSITISTPQNLHTACDFVCNSQTMNGGIMTYMNWSGEVDITAQIGTRVLTITPSPAISIPTNARIFYTLECNNGGANFNPPKNVLVRRTATQGFFQIMLDVNLPNATAWYCDYLILLS